MITPFHNVHFLPTQQPVAIGKPQKLPKTTLGNIMPRIFNKIQSHNIPVAKLIVKKQINTAL